MNIGLLSSIDFPRISFQGFSFFFLFSFFPKKTKVDCFSHSFYASLISFLEVLDTAYSIPNFQKQDKIL